jgi:nucleoside-diphosphate-sugar epimerase
MKPKRVFVAGGTGYTGRVFVEEARDLDLCLLMRPSSPSAGAVAGRYETVVCDPLDEVGLADAMAGSDAVLQLIGITRAQFPQGMTYERIDYGSTVALGRAALASGVPHFVFLSALGAGHPVGDYLRWKRAAEDWLANSGLTWTAVRASFIAGPGRQSLDFSEGAFAAMSRLPLAGAVADDVRPIPVAVLARGMRRIVERGEPTGVVSGRHLWHMEREGGAAAARG